jgi:hypothetical protein
MKTVRDIFVDVLAMKRRRDSLEKIRDYIIDTGHDNGFQEIGEPSAPNVAEFTFANGDTTKSPEAPRADFDACHDAAVPSLSQDTR